MRNTYCIIKVYAATNNEYVVKDSLTFDEAQEEFERFNNMPVSTGEPCMYIIGDSGDEIDHIDDSVLLDDEEDDYDLERELESFNFSGYDDE